MESQVKDEDRVGPDGFGGMLVVAFEGRMAAETAALITRFGGRPLVAPAMREAPLEDNPAAFEFAARLVAGRLDAVIFLTGVGTRALFAAVASRYPRDVIVGALSKVITVARGPKPVAALREFGVAPTIVIDEPNTWREILVALDRRDALAGKRVAVQEYGVTNRDLMAGLEARSAEVMAVPVYRWTLPADRGPLREAIATIAAGRAGAVIFTSSNQVTNVIRTAEADGVADQFRRGLAATIVGSIGPVCSEQLRALQIHIDLEPSHPKLGHLIKEMAAASVRLRAGGAGARATIVADAPAVSSEPRNPLDNHPFMRACRREPVPYTPIWLMRQAGRYMPEYRRVRDQHPFLDLCRRPELAAEVTVTAVERLGVDAAIIFADILLPLIPLGVGLRYEAGDGPLIERPVRSIAELEKLPSVNAAESLSFVGDSIRLVDRAIGDRTPIIGFAGAPFTLASYLIEGGSSRQYQTTKTLAYNEPATWHRLMTMLAAVTADYLKMQIAAGADVVQLFDSWVGSLGPDDYRRLVLPYTQSVITAVRGLAPVIHFGTITGNLLELMREAGGDVIGLDWRVDLAEAWARLGYDVGVQGNLDPIALFADRAEIRRRARVILDKAEGRPGHIFNLGHGILPETPVDHVIALVDAVHEMSRR
ncbi:MAG: uroporphyrinogen decarboxylase [Candidatus Binataceae bacterium]